MTDPGMKLSVEFKGEDITSIGKKLAKAIEASKPEIERAMAQDFIVFFRKNLKKNGLGLIPLRATSIAQKRKLGLKYPASPMYGTGELDTESFVSNVSVVSNSKGVSVAPSMRQHHGGLTVQKLAIIQASGYKVKKTIVPSRNPIQAAAKLYRPRTNVFAMMKIIKNRFKALWK